MPTSRQLPCEPPTPVIGRQPPKREGRDIARRDDVRAEPRPRAGRASAGRPGAACRAHRRFVDATICTRVWSSRRIVTSGVAHGRIRLADARGGSPLVLLLRAKDRVPCRTGGTEPHRDVHPREHLRHPSTHVVRDHDLHAVVLEKARDARVMHTLGPGVMVRPPADVELLPAFYAPAADQRDRDALRASPAWIDEAVWGDRDTDGHRPTVLRPAKVPSEQRFSLLPWIARRSCP